MTEPYEVTRFGTDTSQRPILLNQRMIAAWKATLAALDFTPLIVQGAYMARVPGGGAADSAGYHDAGGCIDTRTRDLSIEQEQRLIRAARGLGWAVWKRDQAHGGMDEHMHWVLLDDRDAASGARSQMAAYRAGRDGLDGGGADYHWRPNPIPVFKLQEDDMPTPQDLLNAEVAKDVSLKKAVREMHEDVTALKKAFNEFRDNELTRDKKRAKETEARAAKVLAAIDAIEVPEGMTKQEFRDITREVVQAQLGKLE
ncbi:MAG: hypothetical protein H0W95_00755 [Nocardioidaceae bacterium]|nr:hypothetical protein [Nocardioidaceae bacterium]